MSKMGFAISRFSIYLNKPMGITYNYVVLHAARYALQQWNWFRNKWKPYPKLYAKYQRTHYIYINHQIYSIATEMLSCNVVFDTRIYAVVVFEVNLLYPWRKGPSSDWMSRDTMEKVKISELLPASNTWRLSFSALPYRFAPAHFNIVWTVFC